MIDTVPSLGCGFLHDHQTNSPDRTGGGGKTRTQSAVGSMNNLQQFRKSSMDLVCWSGAQQDAVWNRQHVANQLRSLLCEYYAAFLEAFPGSSRWTGVSGGLAYPDACAVLAIASTPTQAARLTYSRLNAALRREDRQRGVSCLHSAAASVELAPDLADPAPDATGCAPSSDPARSFPTRIEWHLHAVPSSASGSAPQVFVIDSSRRVSLPRSTRVPLGPTRRTFSSDL